MPHLQLFDPFAHVERTHGKNLPHWEQPGACYFVTFRTADSLPASLLSEWKTSRDAWLALHPRPWTPEKEAEYHRLFSEVLEYWLDQGHGACHLRQEDNRSVVATALNFFDTQRYHQHAWIIMPNHCHCLFSLHPNWKLAQVLHSWKSYTGTELNKRLGLKESFWQSDFRDRLVRDQKHFARCVRYIRRNPQKARLRAGEFTLYESELAQAIPINSR